MKMDDLWKRQLPVEYINQVIRPIDFDHHSEPSANAEKIIGFDSRGDKCFYIHSFLLTELAFDADEFPVLVDIYYEHVIAWRLRQGQWIKIKSFADQLDRCNRNYLKTLPVELAETI
jgi:hypothetical protein